MQRELEATLTHLSDFATAFPNEKRVGGQLPGSRLEAGPTVLDLARLAGRVIGCFVPSALAQRIAASGRLPGAFAARSPGFSYTNNYLSRSPGLGRNL